MRVISGKARGRRLCVLSNGQTRPVLDRVKESLFNILSGFVENSIVLDLFAGTGSLGIEALSRGAKRCLFVDNDIHAVQVIEKNLQSTNLLEKATVLKKDVFNISTFLTNKSIKHDLVLVAPPYKLMNPDCKDRKRIFSLLDECVQVLDEKGIIVLQHQKKQIVDQGNFELLKIVDQRQYGNTRLTFLETRSP